MTLDAARHTDSDPAEAAAAEKADESRAASRLEAGEALLKSARPDLADFFKALYHGAPPEDITRYTAASLAELSQLVFACSEKRRADETIVEILNFKAEGEDVIHNEMVFLAINDDRPFLFDSLIGEISAQGARIHALFHPVLTVKRDADGRRSESGISKRESVIVLMLGTILSKERQTALVKGAQDVFTQVRLAVRDWRKMQIRLTETIETLRIFPPPVDQEELDESIAFLNWLGDNHFTFLGSRDYAFTADNGGRLEPIADSGLGLLSDVGARVLRRGTDRSSLTAEAREFLTLPSPIIITKSNERSLIHRRVHMDYVGVKTFDKDGKLMGERRFVGLFTSGAYSRRPREIPLLRLKDAHVRERAELSPDSHDDKALAHILDSYPRDELFQVSEDELLATAVGILRLGERPKVRVFLRFDRFDRFVSALVFVPRDRYDTHIREKIHAILAERFDGRMSAATPMLDDSMLARVHYIVGRNEGSRPHIDVHMLESDIRAAIRTWEDGFADALLASHGEAAGSRLFTEHRDAFPPRYRDAFEPEEAVLDLDELKALVSAENGLRIHARVYRDQRDAHSALRLKLYVLGSILPLSASMPLFENLGFRVIAEDSYPVSLQAGSGWKQNAAVLDFQMERADGGPAELFEIKSRLEEAFHAVVSGDAESDGFNRLIVSADLGWRDVTILRATAKFLRQAGIAFSQDYMEQALTRNPDIAALIVDLFHAFNNPELANTERDLQAQTIRARIESALNDVPSLDDDRIIRRMRNVVDSMLRTNFYQHDDNGKPKPYLSFKLDSQKIDDLPAPRPHVEIFVYSPEVEGVHLRFGKVARGGIRWSDRREDFRTEILGLVKAQQVKNAVIVPVGAKGGFYPKRLPVNASREDVQAAAINAYKTFIHALLDLTDNIHPDGSVASPADVLRKDDDDPYLVVAADKGTATFSDIANGIAMDRGFWLGDAFASGGSHGYDHKKMGITARGAWEAVKRHFREMGRDIQNEPFTAIGVGDMSGDVFGNGMQLSRHIRLLAAFDHRHIFVDPNPDAAKSWAERARLFALPRSSWADYNTELISAGGGVFPRTAKEIALTAEMKALTGIAADTLSPTELVKALLNSETDLLWFGGIGTYIKASTQNNLDVGDRTNDALRVDGRDVRAKVIGEGANLGTTQLGRIEYARKGGRINTDAIDNSAGVDTSDHEVNLKILFSGPLRRDEITTATRDDMLQAMTEDVAAHVLKDNYDQTLALSIAQTRGLRDLDAHCRLIRDLQRRNKLDRNVEFLPDDEALRKRAQEGAGLTRPELAVLLAYAKLDLSAEIAASDLPDDPYFVRELESYFPPQAVEKFRHEMENHRLRREIVSTVLTNQIVNLAGPVFVHRIKEISGVQAARVARAFVLADGSFGLSALKARIDALDYKVPFNIQAGMYIDVAELLRRLGLWFLVNVPEHADLEQTIMRYHSGIKVLRGTFSTLVSDYEAQDTEARIKRLQDAGVPSSLAEDLAVLPLLEAAPEILLLAHARDLDVDLVAGTYFAVGKTIGLDRLRGQASRIIATEHWDRLAIRRIIDDLFAGQRALAAKILASGPSGQHGLGRQNGAKLADAWAESHAEALARTHDFLDELERTGELTIAKLTLVNSQVNALAQH